MTSQFLRPWPYLLAALFCVICIPSRAADAPTRPNIVIILADDLGWGSLGCYGSPRLETPACDRLAREGRRFTNAYAPGSVCSPTRYALMTGRYFWRTKMNDGGVLPPDAPLHIETNRLTLGSLAKSCGYHTAAVGKWHLGLGAARKTDWNAPLHPGPLQVGFDYFFGLAANVNNRPDAYIENDQILDRTPGQLVAIEGVGKDQKTVGISPVRADDQVMGRLTQKAVKWIEENHREPFLLYFAPNAVHEPVTPSPQFTGSPFGKYGDFIHELDWSVGRITETLERLKLTENTIVIFTSDNGGALNIHLVESMEAMKAGLAINGPLRDGKGSIWEGGFREPFIVRWPGKVPAGTVCDDVTSLSDVLATLAGILHAPIPSGNAEDSLDASSLWLGQTTKPARESIVLQAEAAAAYAVRRGPWKMIERENPPPFNPRDKGMEQRIVNARQHGPQHDELYNLADDPTETKDVAAAHPEIVAQMRKILAETRHPSAAPNAASRPPVATRVRFLPAHGSAGRELIGGVFEGSNVSATEGFALLAKINSAPPNDQWSELPCVNETVYRWLRYVAPAGSHARLASVEFYDGDQLIAGDGKGVRRSAFAKEPLAAPLEGRARYWYEADSVNPQLTSYDLVDAATAPRPSFKPARAEQPGPVDVTLNSAPGAVIRYTLDGSWPSPNHGEVYERPIPISKTTTISAVAIAEGRAPSHPSTVTYLIGAPARPVLSSAHIGNSLTATTGGFPRYARSAGYEEKYVSFLRGGALTKELWALASGAYASDPAAAAKEAAALKKGSTPWSDFWKKVGPIDILTVQPRDFKITEEAAADIQFFNLFRQKSPDLQPWLYCEWTEINRARVTDKGELASRQLSKLYPALTWEESMGAMLLYMEDLQQTICETYHDGKRPRILPAALAMGWLKDMIDSGQLPGLSPGSFYPLLFADGVHPAFTPAVGSANGAFVVDSIWHAAFYRESPEGKVLPLETTFTPEQARLVQRLAWGVSKNYPDCGMYEEGSTPCGLPQLTRAGLGLGEVTPCTLSSSTPGAWFRYTLDGTVPTRTRGLVYCGVISVRPGMIVKAVAYRSGMADSAPAELIP